MSDYISTPENPNGDIIPDVDFGKYTGLHQHSVFSPLDGYGKLEDYALRAKALGFEGLCISDHGNMIAHIKQRDICKKHGIKPIYANEGYFTLHDGNIKEKIEGYKSAYHILLIAMNDVGYANLRKATSIAWTKYKYYKPRFDMALLEECSEGIICTSACLGGAISQLFLSDRAEEAEEVALRLNRIFPGRFYLELTYTGLEEQHLANNFLRELSAKHNIPLIITADSHYVYKYESDAHMKLVMINTGGKLNKEKKDIALNDTAKEDSDVDSSGMFYQPGQYYVKPFHILRDEYYNSSSDLEAFENTNIIARQCNVDLVFEDKMIFPQPYDNPHEVLKQKVMEWYRLYTKDFDDNKKNEYLSRLELELDVYDKMDFSSYPLVLEDIVDFAKNEHIPIGPGRGCLTEDARVFVRIDGMYDLVHIDEVEVGHEVFTHKCRWQKVTNTFKYDIKEELIELHSECGELSYPITLTKDHKVLSNNMEWVKAEDMSVGDSVFTPIIPPETNNEIGIVYGDVDSGDYDTDERLLINENISFMLGFLSGDSVTFKRDKTKVELFIESHTKQSVFSKLLYILESNQFPHEVDYNGGYSKIKVVLNDYKFAAIVDTLFFYPEAPFEEKAMSEISYAMNHVSLRSFITGYLESSGYFDNKKEAYVVSTASWAIVDDLILLCTRLGCSFKIEEINGKAWSIEVGYWNDVVLSSEETGIMIEHKIVGINTVPKNKVSVYDLEVEEDHSYTTTNFIVHNSAAGSLISFALGITNIDPIPYNLMFSRYLSAGRAKYPLIEFDGYPLSDWNHGQE